MNFKSNLNEVLRQLDKKHKEASIIYDRSFRFSELQKIQTMIHAYKDILRPLRTNSEVKQFFEKLDHYYDNCKYQINQILDEMGV